MPRLQLFSNADKRAMKKLREETQPTILTMAKTKTDKDTAAKGFAIEPAENNPNVQPEEAVEADNSPVEEAKGISLYIDPAGEKSTALAFVLADKEISLQTVENKIAEYDKLEINGFLDKKNYALVKAAKSEFLKTRTKLNESAKQNVIDPINKWVKNYKDGLKEVSDKLQSGQDKMEAKLKAIDDAFEAEQKRIEEEEQARLQGRVSALAAVGAIFDNENGKYTFPHDAGLLINSIQAKTFSVEEWDEFLAEATTSWETEQTRIRLENEQKEAEEEKNRALLAGLQTKTTALEEKQIKLRTKELMLNGAEVVEGGFVINGHQIVNEVLKALEDYEWDELMGLVQEIAVEEVEDQSAPTEKHTAIIAGPPVAEASTGYAPSPGFLVEDDQQEVSYEIPENDTKSFLFEHNFTADKPFLDHHFNKVTLRLYPDMFEMEANEDVAPADIVDAGAYAGTELKYLQIKRQR